MSAAGLARRLAGRRAFITGGGSGLGLALATALAADGWTIGLLDRDEERLAPAAEALTVAGAAAVLTFGADVTNEHDFGAAVRAFAARTGGLDLMVNNAGVAVAGAVGAIPVADWRWALEINVVGVALGCQLALAVMQHSGRGCIINVASAAAFASAPKMGAYNASKAAVLSLTETLAAELHGGGISTLVAMPGFFQTRLLETMRAPPGASEEARRLMKQSRYTAARAAADILDAAAAGRLYAVLPRAYVAFWRIKRLLPTYFIGRLARLGWRGAPRS